MRVCVQDVLSCYGLAGYAPFLGPYLDTMSQYINMDTVDQLLGVCRPRDGPAEALPRDGTAQVEQLQRDMALGFGRDQVVALLHKVEGYAPSPALKRVVGVAEDFVRAEFMADVCVCPACAFGASPTLRQGGRGGAGAFFQNGGCLLGMGGWRYANYWAPLTRKRHIPPHPAHQPLGSANAATTPAGAPAAAADRTQRRDATCEGKTGGLSRAP